LRKKISSSNFLITGVARNCEKSIENEIKNLSKAFAKGKNIEFLIVVSDSQDKTLKILESLSGNVSLKYISLGNLKDRFPKRSERIAVCRNHYLDEIKKNDQYKNIDYVVVADLDGVNSKVTVESISSCWNISESWDACFANQSAPYYDIWALRHKEWSPNNWQDTYKFLINNGCDMFSALDISAYSKMIRIKSTCKPIEVDSAFGGLGIYKKEVIVDSKYFGLDKNNNEICEHVPLNQNLRKKGYKLFIAPKLINCGWNTHNKNLKLIYKIINRFKYFLKHLRCMFKKKKYKINFN